jgi:hypothetical protein
MINRHAGAAAAILVMLTLAGCWYSQSEYQVASESSRPAQLTSRADDLYGNTPLDATLLRLDRNALDEAYQAQVLKLWGVYLADGAKDPTYFKNGMNNVRRAYTLALQAIIKRERELERQQQPDK